MANKESERNNIVFKHNDLIHKCRFDLTQTQYKVVTYVMSKIEKNDTELQWVEFDIAYYCKLAGIDRNHFYTDFKKMIDNLDDKKRWIEMDDIEFRFSWFPEVEINKKTNRIRLRLNSNLTRYLIGLKNNYTNYPLIYILAFKSVYSIRLYELLKSLEYKHTTLSYDLDELKAYLQASSYTNFAHFNRRCLDVAIREINEYSDIEINYTIQKKGKKVIGIDFQVNLKESVKRLMTSYHIEEILDNGQ